MKREVIHPAPSERAQRGPRYWRSLDELAETPGFRKHLEREFPEGAWNLEGVDRRHFMKIMAASFALGGAGMAGCRRPESNILPYGRSVEGQIPGLPLYYSTAMPWRRYAMPLIAETHQGRPTKVEGNPGYAPHGGASSLHAQASLLDMYDPDRAKAHTQDGRTLEVAEVNALLARIGSDHADGQGLAFLAGFSSSPTRARLVESLKAKFPHAVWAEYEAVSEDPPVEATQTVFGRPLRPIYRFAAAKRIVSIDGDFLGTEAGKLYYSREFAKGRRVKSKDDPMSRLYMAESGFTLTGSMADHRLRVATSHMLAFAAALASKITGDATFDRLAQGLDLNPQWIEECAADLSAHKGECLVVAGCHLPAAVHAIAHAINAALGNLGSTVDFVELTEPAPASLADLAGAIRGGRVKTLVILGGNPVYNAPADLDWASLQKSVPQVVRLGYYVDETSAYASVNLAEAHYLESWGDGRTFDGTVVPIQPMILPLFGGLTEIEVLARIAGEADPDPHALVQATFATLPGGKEPKAFEKFLYDGFLEGTAYPTVSPDFNGAGIAALANAAGRYQALSLDSLEVRLVADYKVDDGRFANNGWLQECPDPMTKVSWDNLILVSPKLGKALGIQSKGSVLQVARDETEQISKGNEGAPIGELTVNGRSVRGPMHIQPGLSDFTVVLPLGYGRTVSGHIGTHAGFNAYVVRTSDAMHVATGGKLRVTGEHMLVANVQEHWSMEGRALVREANLSDFQEHPDFAQEESMEAETPPLLTAAQAAEPVPEQVTNIPRGNSLYTTPVFKDHIEQWGMNIDLNTCIGCNACVVACQAENNIPIVGKDQSIRGRQMHWIRIDRYFSDGHASTAAFGGEGNREIPEDPQVSLQPVACMQCELAPCEMVCPVNATIHDDQGLNVMAYNRCIGTRYCANNCPYKVRRFNYFDWNERSIDSLYMGPLGPHGMPELLKMAKNPQVTVRMRGVMEKCTYCVQRIENGKINWKVKSAREGDPGNVTVPDGYIKTACQQVCPVEAIVFGNILDPNSEVSQAKARVQDYALLGYLNTRPRTTYLARLRNPNPRMPDYHALPLSRAEHDAKSDAAFPKNRGDN
ncbi:MAG TPA: TAT-variant-translocated molybdopterin oxidoreductase [Opitutaceae bacterium]|jgi:molybdopterin-containing oxidoreductase family iron-sulfur binding subunit|nr:TAT-variant-translocated molybdopterin oxidoreductase [Opitutaceae bacterium]